MSAGGRSRAPWPGSEPDFLPAVPPCPPKSAGARPCGDICLPEAASGSLCGIPCLQPHLQCLRLCHPHSPSPERTHSHMQLAHTRLCTHTPHVHVHTHTCTGTHTTHTPGCMCTQHTHTRTHMPGCVCTHVHTHAQIHTTHAWICVYTHVRTQTRMHRYTHHTCLDVCAHYTHVHTCAHICTGTHHTNMPGCVCAHYIHMYIRVYVCTGTHIIYTRSSVLCTHYAHMYCTCTHAQVHTTRTCPGAHTIHTCMCTHIAFAHVCIHYTHARVHMYTPLHMCMLTCSHACSSPHAPMPTRVHTHPARMSWLWPSGPVAATPHGRSPLPPHHAGQGRPPHAFSRWAVSPRLLPHAGATVAAPLQQTPQATPLLPPPQHSQDPPQPAGQHPLPATQEQSGCPGLCQNLLAVFGGPSAAPTSHPQGPSQVRVRTPLSLPPCSGPRVQPPALPLEVPQPWGPLHFWSSCVS